MKSFASHASECSDPTLSSPLCLQSERLGHECYSKALNFIYLMSKLSQFWQEVSHIS